MKRICAKEKNWGRDTQSDIVRASQAFYDSVKHCPVRLDFVWVGVSGKFEKKMNCLRLKPNFEDMI
jgi:hypothetical protein